MSIQPLPLDQDAMRRLVANASRAVTNRKDLSLRDKAVACRLLDHVHTKPSHRKFGTAWPPMADLAELEGACERTIRRSISRIAKLGLFKISYGYNFGANHASTYDPEWDALLNVEPAPKPDIAPESPEPEMSSKRDNTAIETGQNCPPNLSINLTKKEPSLTLPQETGGDSSPNLIVEFEEALDSEILPPETASLSSLTLEQAQQALDEWQRMRGTGRRGPYGKRELVAHIKNLVAQAEADNREAERAKKIRIGAELASYLEQKSPTEHAGLKRAGKLTTYLSAWVGCEVKDGNGEAQIDAFILRCEASRRKADPVKPPPPPARQESKGRWTGADTRQMVRQIAQNRWIRDVGKRDDGAEILEAVMADKAIEDRATSAEGKRTGTGLGVILDWWQHRDREAA